MMSESLESRKFERKPMFDVPLPMRRAQRPQTAGSDGSDNERVASPPPLNTMAVSLMTKRGNKQQVFLRPKALNKQPSKLTPADSDH